MQQDIGMLKASRRSGWLTTNPYRNQPDAFYRSPGMAGIRADRVRTIDDAARRFAHRLSQKLFGSYGRCYSVARIGANREAVRYRAVLRGGGGRRQRIELDVWRP
jgi:hypothetical protein